MGLGLVAPPRGRARFGCGVTACAHPTKDSAQLHLKKERAVRQLTPFIRFHADVPTCVFRFSHMFSDVSCDLFSFSYLARDPTKTHVLY